MLRRFLRSAVVLAFTFAAPLAQARPGVAITMAFVDGKVTDTSTGAPIANVCVILGPALINCATQTDATGYYKIDSIPDLPGGSWEVNSIKQGYSNGHQAFTTDGTSGHYVENMTMTATSGSGIPPIAGTPTQTVYLPNITKMLGGPSGWQTPFIVQNVGPANTDLELSFYRFADGALVSRWLISALKPGTSFADVPNNDPDLPPDGQFSVVVRSFGANVVAVVNEHAGTGARAEAGSYVGTSAGASSVFLPNITRRFFGFVSPFIIQNLGSAPTTAVASFLSFDGTRSASLSRTIAPGQSSFINPNAEPALVDGTQYAVSLSSPQPIGVVVNTHRDDPAVASPLMYSTNGLTEGAPSVFGPFAVKNLAGVGEGVSSIVVQNLGPSPISPSLAFTPLGGGPVSSFGGPLLAPQAAWAFDPRYAGGDVTKALCGAAASAGCLADGEYSFVASAPAGGQVAAVVNVIGTSSASGYTAQSHPAAKVYLPNITRSLGGAEGWSTPFFVQAVSATGATLSYYRFADGALVTTQSLSLPAGGALRVDPRGVPGLADNGQYAVVIDGGGGTLTAIVHELNFQGGDGAMDYEGFAQ